MIKQIIMQSSDKQSIVLDCFAGSGVTLECANELGRKWIGVDNSKVAIEKIKSREIGEFDFINVTKYQDFNNPQNVIDYKINDVVNI